MKNAGHKEERSVDVDYRASSQELNLTRRYHNRCKRSYKSTSRMFRWYSLSLKDVVNTACRTLGRPLGTGVDGKGFA
eukprot:8000708-Pyramimonas_sp.AAC.1